jgi:hypothetical protein
MEGYSSTPALRSNTEKSREGGIFDWRKYAQGSVVIN